MNVFRGLRTTLYKTWYQMLGYGENSRNLIVFPDDRFLVGYPKSGNTWLSFLVAGLLTRTVEEVDFFSIERIVADIYFNNAKQLYCLPRPRCLKSHEPFDVRYGKVVYIVRDPRDVAVSYYYHYIKLGMIDARADISSFVRRFIHGKLDGFGSWGEHVTGWVERRSGDPDFLLVRYEDLKQDAIRELAKISTHLGVNAPPEVIQNAVSWASVGNMRRLESEAVMQGHPAFCNTRKDILFVRKGVSGGWKGKIDLKDARLIEEVWGEIMQELGYLS